MKAFLTAVVAAVTIAVAAHWALTTRLEWSSAGRFAAEETVRLTPVASVRAGF